MEPNPDPRTVLDLARIGYQACNPPGQPRRIMSFKQAIEAGLDAMADWSPEDDPDGDWQPVDDDGNPEPEDEG